MSVAKISSQARLGSCEHIDELLSLSEHSRD